jgi:hypothetical protein
MQPQEPLWADRPAPVSARLHRNSSRLGPRQQLQKRGIDEEFLPSGLALLKNTDVAQLLEVDRSRLTLRDARLHQIPNSAVWLHEDELGQFTRI